MRNDTQTKRVLALARQKGILRPSQVQGAGIPRVILSRLATSGLLERTARGLYRLPDAQFSETESLSTVAAKAPQAVFCLLTALQFHGLTTQLPRQVWIAMPRGSHVPQIAYPPVKMVQFSGEAYSEGIETHYRDHVPMKIYSAAKTVVDCFKHRNKIGLDVAVEALRDARAKKKASISELWHFAKINRVANVMRPYLEAFSE